MVHVGFKRKFKDLVTLKQLQALGGSETPLQNMQVLKQSRLSVSKVSAEEWAFIMEMVESRELDKSNDS
jgi:predicted RNA-binding protein with PUA-like domain